MSKHKDYTRYSNREQRTETKLMEEAENQIANIEFEAPAIEEPEVKERVVESKQGVVTDCIKLNVRVEPSSTADVVCEITVATKLVVYENESTDEFYKICTYSGVEGYCMKKYITILP